MWYLALVVAVGGRKTRSEHFNTLSFGVNGYLWMISSDIMCYYFIILSCPVLERHSATYNNIDCPTNRFDGLNLRLVFFLITMLLLLLCCAGALAQYDDLIVCLQFTELKLFLTLNMCPHLMVWLYIWQF